jgi:large subunit ribosomal protein LP2
MSIKYVSSYLLANVAGHESPSVSDIEKILKAAGGSADKEVIEKLVSQLKGKNITEAIVSGKAKLFSAVFAAAAPVAAASASPKKAAAAAKKEEPKEEEEEAGAFSLFD